MKLTIEKVIYGGQGLARIPVDLETSGGMSIFVPLTLPGEIVEAEITQRHRGYCIGEAREIAKASEFRTAPPCPWFGTCGGCQLQHSLYPYQVELKRQMLVESLTRAGVRDLPPISLLFAQPLGYRNRVRVQVQTQPEFSVGYRKAKSHRMTAIDRCPIAAPLLEECIRALHLLGAKGSFPADTQEVEIFTNHDQSELFMTMWTSRHSRSHLIRYKEFFANVQKEIPQLSGAQVLAVEKGKLATASPLLQWGRQHLNYRVAGREYIVGAGSFFQVNRTLLDEFVAAVIDDESGSCVWDLFAGVGLFSLALMERFQRVLAVESNPSALKDMRQNLRGSTTTGKTAKEIQSETLKFLQQSLQRQEPAPDLILLDPPRAGAGVEACNLMARSNPRKIVYVSCDPATLGRDLGALIQSGYRLRRLQLVDMFPQTYHMETIATLDL
ncbi:MAG: 23S rRNA (uracil(1939)-C(5))-methyltransferase RlmD [Terriglobia bacterium]|nr:23S rRNA (uracil(1939)-C(5))-methyltransferase RlmD [Terriglobia bacterium]